MVKKHQPVGGWLKVTAIPRTICCSASIPLQAQLQLVDKFTDAVSRSIEQHSGRKELLAYKYCFVEFI